MSIYPDLIMGSLPHPEWLHVQPNGAVDNLKPFESKHPPPPPHVALVYNNHHGYDDHKQQEKSDNRSSGLDARCGGTFNFIQ